MTTHVLVVNHGPGIVDVLTMEKGKETVIEGQTVHAPDAMSETNHVDSHSQRQFMIHKTQYIVVREEAPKLST